MYNKLYIIPMAFLFIISLILHSIIWLHNKISQVLNFCDEKIASWGNYCDKKVNPTSIDMEKLVKSLK